jgi:hypothetical protein
MTENSAPADTQEAKDIASLVYQAIIPALETAIAGRDVASLSVVRAALIAAIQITMHNTALPHEETKRLFFEEVDNLFRVLRPNFPTEITNVQH